MSESQKIVVIGSCVSRDALNYAQKNGYTLVEYFARSSLGSALSEQMIDNICLDAIASSFQRRVVGFDLFKTAVDTIAQAEFDILLMDFIDERFNLFRMPNGAIGTLSNELLSSGFNLDEVKGERISSGSGEFFTLWEDGWGRLVDVLKRTDSLHKVRINSVYWADQTRSGQNFLPSYSDNGIRRANVFLDKIYARVREDIPENQFIIYPPHYLIGADEHQWGISPFHYIDELYNHTLAQLDIPKNNTLFLKDKKISITDRKKNNVLDDRIIEEGVYYSTHDRLPSALQSSGAIEFFNLEPSNLAGNCRAKKLDSYISGLCAGGSGAYELRLKLPTPLLGSGINVRFRLSGWDAIRYVAIGYTNKKEFRHVKVVHFRQSTWIEFDFSHDDLAYGWRNNWEQVGVFEIPDIRIYISGSPSEEGAYLDVSDMACWREGRERHPPWLSSWNPVHAGPSARVIELLYDYNNKALGDIEGQAVEFMGQPKCPLMRDIGLDWPVFDRKPITESSNGTYRYTWHGFHPPLILMLHAQKTGDIAPIFAARDFINAWIEDSYLLPDTDQKFAWYDHGTAERLIAMLMMWGKGLELGFDYRFMARLRDVMFRHAQLLASELFYASHQSSRYHNHAWFQDIALISWCMTMPDIPCSARYMDIAIERLSDQFDKLIVRDEGYAIFVENSVGYHQGVQRLIDLAGALIDLSGQRSDIANIAVELDKFSAFFKYPDGRAPAQGDTFRLPNRTDNAYAAWVAPYVAPHAVILSKAGYAVVKGNHDDRPFMFSMFATSLSKTHKHADNLSFTLYFDALEWLIDPSMYSHEYVASIPAYLRGPAAHNAVFIPDVPYSIDPGMASLSGACIDKDFTIYGHHNAYDGIDVQRDVSGRLDSIDFNFIDTVPAGVKAAMMLHCGDGVVPHVEGNIIRLSHELSEFIVEITLPEGQQAKIFHGVAIDDKIRGITGLGFGQARDIYTLEYPFDAAQKVMQWRLRAKKA